jgi:hypothetical protein
MAKHHKKVSAKAHMKKVSHKNGHRKGHSKRTITKA